MLKKSLTMAAIVCLVIVLFCNTVAAVVSPVSYVDYSNSKATLMVDGEPFFYIGAQVSTNWLKDYNWTWQEIAPMIEQAASDGYSVVTVPIRWAWIEPTENNFNWTDVDTLLSYCDQYNIKCEILWFGSDVCGKQTGTPTWVKNKYQAVLKSDGSVVYDDKSFPKLDKTDPNLLQKEMSTLSSLMNHIASEIAEQNYSNLIIGMQVLNEPSVVNLFGSSPTDRSYSSYANALWQSGSYTDVKDFNSDILYNYLNQLSKVIKESQYPVWTRTNFALTLDLDLAYEIMLKKSINSNNFLDFVGTDPYYYEHNVIYSLTNEWEYLNNISEVMENSGSYSNTVQLMFNAYAANGIYDVFEIANTDPTAANGANGMYLTDFNTKTITPRSHVEGVRNFIAMMKKDSYDLITKHAGTNGNRVVFFNRDFNANSSTSAEVGVGNGINRISYTTSNTGGGIAIVRDPSTFVFMSTQAGQFSVPATYILTSLEKGYYNDNNLWVNQGTVTSSTVGNVKTFSIGAGECVRMTYYDSSNLAHGKTATMLNGSVGWEHEANHALDGDYTTYAQSSEHVLWDLLVDLGEMQTFNKVTFSPGTSNYAVQYDVMVSSDGQDFTTVASEEAGIGLPDSLDFQTVTARYVKFHARSDSGFNHVIRDIGVYNANVAIGKSASMIGDSPLVNHAASCAIDGNLSTSAQSGTDSLWDLQIDLGEQQYINKAVLSPGDVNYATQYNIQTSLDGTTFTTVATESAGDGTVKTYYFPSILSRYVRIQVNSENGNGHEIRELELFHVQNLALGQSAWMLEDAVGWNHCAAFSVDGTFSKYTQSAGDTCWDFVVDLGAVREVGTVSYMPGTSNYATQYNIMTSSDGVTFTTAANESNGDGLPKTYSFTPVLARYVKIQVVAENGENHVIREMAVFR